MKTEKQTWDARLSATPCDREMREAMVNRAKAEGKKLAQLQREAFAFFLLRNDTDFVNLQKTCQAKEGQ